MKKIWGILVIIISIVAVWYLKTGRYQPPGRPRSANDQIKSNLAGIRANSALIYADKKSYASVCVDELNLSMISSAEKVGKSTNKCFADLDSFVVSAKLKNEIGDKEYFCVDSKGSMKEITSAQEFSILNADTPCSDTQQFIFTQDYEVKQPNYTGGDFPNEFKITKFKKGQVVEGFYRSSGCQGQNCAPVEVVQILVNGQNWPVKKTILVPYK